MQTVAVTMFQMDVSIFVSKGSINKLKQSKDVNRVNLLHPHKDRYS